MPPKKTTKSPKKESINKIDKVVENDMSNNLNSNKESNFNSRFVKR